MGTATPVIERSPGFYLINQLDGLDNQFLGSNEMRLRTPPNLPQASDPFVFNESDPRDFTVRIITPIYGGGVESRIPDREMPFRLTSINYQLRFWWRLHKIKELRERGIDGEQLSKKLFEEECQLWGALAGKRQYSSKVRMQILNPKYPDNFPYCCKYDLVNNKLKFLHNIPPYALFPGRGIHPNKRSDPPKPDEKPAKVILPDSSDSRVCFTLRMTCMDDTKWSEVERALRWWASFGGLGARTRRGLGSVYVKQLKPVEEELKRVEKEEAKRFGCLLMVKAETQSNPIDAWGIAVRALQKFRQGPKNRRRWPESDALCRITGITHVKEEHPAGNVFPRGCIGMPITFFQDKPNDRRPDPNPITLRPADWDRLASPLILKALALAEDRYAPCALLLPTDDIKKLALILTNTDQNKPNPNLPQTLAAGKWWPENDKDAMDLANIIPPMQGRHQSDPLLAFLDYFDRGK